MGDCTCEKCIGACKNSPGWFMPGEAEKAAEYLGMTFEDFKKKYLVQEYWEGGADVLAPRMTRQPAGFRRARFSDAFWPGKCVFLKRNRCSIHAHKPFECRQAMPCVNNKKSYRNKIQKAWAAKQPSRTSDTKD